MFLKEVILEGFKSFPDLTKLQFAENLTAVVGPNGSGKSNIIDAIQWVLGELSAKNLRGSKMTDFIFSGSSHRKPVNEAKVSLIFNNSQGVFPYATDTVSVTRQINRDGESFFAINDESCRLKDIEDLLIEGGIHKDSSSILGQGKIESLLMSKPTDRRELFEEAAGIIKYKIRKKEALTKMDNTSLQVRRILDIINEVNRQVKPLKKQVRIANEYKGLLEELTQLEVNLLMDQFQKNQRECTSVQSSLEENKANLAEKKYSLAKDEATILEIATGIKDLDEDIDVGKELVFKKQSKIEMLQSKINMASERVLDLEERKKDKVNSIEELKGLVKRKEDERLVNIEKLAEAEEALKECEDRLSVYTKGEESNLILWDDLSKKKDHYKDSTQEILNENSRQRILLQELEEQATRLETRLQEIQKIKDDAQKEKTDISKRKIALEKEHTERKEKYTDIHFQTKQAEIFLSRYQKSVQELSLTQKKLETEYNSLENKASLLKKYKDEEQDLPPGVKAVLMEGKNKRLEGIFGIVAELYQTEGQYGEAIGTALGGRNQNIIVKSHLHAENAIEYLKREKAGRVTFLPLDLVKARTLNATERQALSMPGVRGIAIDLIKCAEEFHNVFAYLLGAVIVAETLKEAVNVSRAVKNRLMIVTLEGEILSPGGSITGGMRRNQRELSRQKVLQETEEKINNTKKQLIGVNEELAEMTDKVYFTQVRFNELKEELLAKEIKVRDCEKDLLFLEENETKLIIHLGQLTERMQGLNQDLEKVVKDIKLNQERYLYQQKKYQEQKQEMQTVEVGLERLRLEMGDSQGLLMDLRVEMAGKKHDLSHWQEACQQQQTLIDKGIQEIAENEEQVKDLSANLETLQKDSESFVEQIKDLKEKKEDGEINLEKNRMHKRHLQEMLMEKEKEVAAIKRIADELERNLNTFIVDETRLTGEKERITERLHLEYGLRVTEAEKMVDPNISLTAAEDRIIDLRQRKRLLEPVNLGAIDEYKELEERLVFMKEQHKDLIEAQQTLVKIISGLDKTMEERFMEAFNKISVEFTNIYQRLFQGGKANLYLANPENLLETGIEVVSQPPGKNLQKLSLMSGGEKALTAIALIFAVLRVKPSPFYILDEIDAPLDEANVERFNLFLREYCDLSQFIIITHRKRSIAEADTLYGITMEEAGVSTIVSYRLKERAC